MSLYFLFSVFFSIFFIFIFIFQYYCGYLDIFQSSIHNVSFSITLCIAYLIAALQKICGHSGGRRGWDELRE